MFAKAISGAAITLVAILGAIGALVGGGSDGAQPFAARQLAAQAAALPQVQQTPSPSLVAALAGTPTGFTQVAPATKYGATVGSKGAIVVTAKLPKGTPAQLPQGKTPAQNVHGPTSWALLNQAIARIPNYRPGVATWVVTSRYGHWGATDLGNGNIYISPNVPASRVYAVASHEYAHARTSDNYRWNWQAADVALNRWFGGGNLAARERAADCMAIAQGATWTNYTSCQNEHWRQGSRILLAGHRLP